MGDNNGNGWLKILLQTIIMILCLLLTALIGGCGSIVIPKIRADTVDCEYHRANQVINWSCTAAGGGDVNIIEVF